CILLLSCACPFSILVPTSSDSSPLSLHDALPIFRGDAVGGEDHQRPLGDLVDLLDEHGALLLEPVDHELVVHDLVADVDRLVVVLQGAFDGDHGAIDSGAVAARLGKKDGSGAHASHRRSASALVGGRWGKTHHPSTGSPPPHP